MAKSKKNVLRIPYNYTPRPYQIEHVWEPFDAGKKRIVDVWHRRAGKDKDALNLMARQAMARVGSYYYILPTYAQGRKIIWEGIDKDGFKFLDHIPKQLRVRQNNQEMVIELQNGSIIRVLGSDNIDSVMGTNPIGIVYSEYSLHDPSAWDYFRPVLRENGGWAVFTMTPRGRNHGYRLYEGAKKLMGNPNSEWHASLLTIDDTGVVTPEGVDEERASGMDEELIQQEFYCSFSVGQKGAYYAKQMEHARQQSRITNVPFNPQQTVNTSWDWGKSDMTSIWFTQCAGAAINVPMYYENNTEEIIFYAKELARIKREYNIEYDYHFVPHDSSAQRMGMQDGSLAEQLQDNLEALGIEGTVVPLARKGVDRGVNKVRSIIPRMYFDETHAARGIECLESYTKKWDEKAKVFLAVPLHNWASHGADAIRTLAMSDAPELEWSGNVATVNPFTGEPVREHTEVETDRTVSDFNVFGR